MCACVRVGVCAGVGGGVGLNPQLFEGNNRQTGWTELHTHRIDSTIHVSTIHSLVAFSTER